MTIRAIRNPARKDCVGYIVLGAESSGRTPRQRIKQKLKRRDEESRRLSSVLPVASPIALRVHPHALHRLLDTPAKSLFPEGITVMLRPYPSVAM
jgi:hypothetical protein